MKKKSKFRRSPFLNFFICVSILLSAQVPAKASEEDFVLTIQNIVQTATNVLEFDIYLLDTDPTQPLNYHISKWGLISTAIF
ncbi:MAG: hypothetical protein IPH20_07425 [Bacteroidales bacterium]|nr:hypothetical protein [Bacteroidales bacterium]